MGWESVGDAATLQAQGHAVYRRDEHDIALRLVKGRWLGFQNHCPHRGLPLVESNIDGSGATLTCNGHLWQFDLATGKCSTVPEPRNQLKLYPTKIENGTLYVFLSAWK